MTTVAPIACPGADALERAMMVGGPGPDEALLRHLDACEACREQQRLIRENLDFMHSFAPEVRAHAAAPVVPVAAPSPDALAGYHLTREIARGGQGVVYDAIQIDTQRRVAVKMIAPIGAADGTPMSRGVRARQRLEREAAIAAGLRHPNIVTVYHSAALPDGRYAIAMEFVDGVPIDAWRPPGNGPIEQRRALLEVFVTVCSAVHHAHLNGVIHRDLKPDNILVTGEGGGRPVVLDFGVAKTDAVHATMTGEFAGTPAYASPEQVAGRPAGVDALTDVYSLGVILYRLLCRRMPYELGESLLDVVRTITQVEPTPPRQLDPTISADLQAIVLRAMDKDKARRYQSAASLSRDLERLLAGEPVEDRSASGWYLLRKAVSINRHRLGAAGAIAAIVVMAGGAVVWSRQQAAASAQREARQREQAEAQRVRAIAVSELLREALPSPDPANPELASIVGSGLGSLYYRLETGAFADRPAVDQELRRLWGSVYTGLGSAKAAGLVQYAEVSLRNGLVRLRTQHGPEHPDIAAMTHELAGVLLVRQRLSEAEAMCAEARDMRRRLFGDDSAQHAESTALMARILLASGKPEAAAEHAARALARFQKMTALDADLPAASMMAIQSRIYLDAGRFDEAEPLVHEALVRRLRRLNPDEPELHASIADAVELAEHRPDGTVARLLAQGWSVEPAAVPAAVRADLPALARNNRSDPTRPVRTGRTEVIGRIVRLTEAALGPDDPALVHMLISQIRAGSGEWLPRTEPALKAAAILGKRFGPQDASRLVCLEEAAASLAYYGGPEQAAELCREICRVRETVPVGIRDELVIINSRRMLGWCLAIAGRHDEAIAELTSVRARFVELTGPEHHLVALTDSTLAMCLAETGSIEQAAEVAARAEQLARRLPTLSIDQIRTIKAAYGHTLLKTGRFAEARDVLQAVWDDWYRVVYPRFPWRALVLNDMIVACEALNDPVEADRWRAVLEEDRRRPDRMPALENSDHTSSPSPAPSRGER